LRSKTGLECRLRQETAGEAGVVMSPLSIVQFSSWKVSFLWRRWGFYQMPTSEGLVI
jgi:hypothetical protein